MKTLKLSSITILLVLISFLSGFSAVKFVEKKDRIDALIDGKYITSYLFGGFRYNKIEGNTGVGGFDNGFVAKPVLYPVKTPSGITITRGYPLENIQGESRDHPGHVGILFAYGRVNKDVNRNSDATNEEFWDNSSDKRQIKHVKILEAKNGKNEGTLKTLNHWIGGKGKILLEEERKMSFKPIKQGYSIDFNVTLTSKDSIVVFQDNKCGLLQIRVADWMRETVESDWMKTRVPNSTGTATYWSSDNEKNEQNIYGRRADWVVLEGNKDGRKAGVGIFDHPESYNHPTYWMVRSYGLFAANPLGQGDYEESRKAKDPKWLNLTLHSGEKVNFRFRMIIYDGEKTDQEIGKLYKEYAD